MKYCCIINHNWIQNIIENLRRNKWLQWTELFYLASVESFISFEFPVRHRCLSNRLCFISEVDDSLFNLRIASWICFSGSKPCFSVLCSPRYCETNTIKREIINTWQINIVKDVPFVLLLCGKYQNINWTNMYRAIYRKIFCRKILNEDEPLQR